MQKINTDKLNHRCLRLLYDLRSFLKVGQLLIENVRAATFLLSGSCTRAGYVTNPAPGCFSFNLFYISTKLVNTINFLQRQFWNQRNGNNLVSGIQVSEQNLRMTRFKLQISEKCLKKWWEKCFWKWIWNEGSGEAWNAAVVPIRTIIMSKMKMLQG